MFAVDVFERDPLHFRDLLAMLRTWAQVAGGFAAVCVLLFAIVAWIRLRSINWGQIPAWRIKFFLGCLVASVLLYVIGGGTWLVERLSAEDSGAPSAGLQRFTSVLLTLAGLFAILAAVFPFVADIPGFSGRRVWALASLTFKEALRRRVLYVFALLLVVFLFANWYVPYNPKDQVRTYVGIVYFAMTPLLLIAALILASFSIPTDIRQQTIHTVLTKPVQRFEVVLGRFLGYVGLLSMVLLVMTTLSLVYVLRNIEPEAAAESLKARKPVYGELSFENTTDKSKGESVGRPWDYRSYISGPTGKPTQYAIWSFPSVPGSLANRKYVPCEFSLDIYRTTKGFENRGVSCRFVFQTWKFNKGDLVRYYDKQRQLQGKPELEANNELAEEFGYFEVPSKDVVDFHTQSINVPAGLFRNALSGTPTWPTDSAGNKEGPPPAIQVRVNCISTTQYIGMARYDLYFREDDPEGSHDRLNFAINFFKGSVGIWYRMVLVTALAVSLSTYLSGVISLLITALLYLGGLFRDFIQSVGEATNIGGGPLEALYRLATRQTMAAPLEKTGVVQTAEASDMVFRFFIRLLLYIFPDVDRFYLTNSVAEGFDIPLERLGMSLLLVVGYVLPWAILAYYLMKWREVASQT